MNFDCYMPVEVISGRDCVEHRFSAVKNLGDRCLIVTGGTSAVKSGALADAENALKKLGIEYDIFDGITQNPYTDDCHKAGERAREIGADFILGIGGGSPLDASKAVAIYASNSHMAPENIYCMDIKNKPLPLVLIGTTAGTGSEVTGVAVLTNSANGMKKSISGKNCYAEISFCDYKYTLTVPYSVTVSTALDALAHAVEAYFSKISNQMSDLYAKKALVPLWKNLKLLCGSTDLPDEKCRCELYEASIFAGLALNLTGTCFPHTMGYVLTEDFNIPHGKACTAFMTEYISMANKYSAEKSKTFFSLLGTDTEEFCRIIEQLTSVDVHMTLEQIDGYAKRWQGPIKNFSRTPGEFTTETAVEILRKFC